MKIQLIDHTDINIVEFVVTEKDEECSFYTEKSKYLHGSVFSILQSSFSLSNKDYAYYELVRFDDQNLISLRNHLQDHFSRLKSAGALPQFEAYLLKQVGGIDFLNELKTFYPNWKITWEAVRDQLLEVYIDLLEMIDLCIDDDKTFWVKGY